MSNRDQLFSCFGRPAMIFVAALAGTAFVAGCGDDEDDTDPGDGDDSGLVVVDERSTPSVTTLVRTVLPTQLPVNYRRCSSGQ